MKEHVKDIVGNQNPAQQTAGSVNNNNNTANGQQNGNNSENGFTRISTPSPIKIRLSTRNAFQTPCPRFFKFHTATHHPDAVHQNKSSQHKSQQFHNHSWKQKKKNTDHQHDHTGKKIQYSRIILFQNKDQNVINTGPNQNQPKYHLAQNIHRFYRHQCQTQSKKNIKYR